MIPSSPGFPNSILTLSSFVSFRVLLLLATMFPFSLSSSKTEAALCPISEYIDDLDKTVTEFFQCPGVDDPPDHVECCEDKCCPQVASIDSVLQVDLRIAMIISLTVIVICLVAGIIIIVCCFASCCPLYEMCTSSGGWTSKADENGALPFPWATEYIEGESAHNGTIAASTLVSSTVVTSTNEKNHRLAEEVDSKDIKTANHV